MDYEVCRKVWESQVPVQFTLHSNSALGDPLPFYTMLPRYSFLALAVPRVLAYFNRREDGEKIVIDQIWLEASGSPAKMYAPVGVLYDLQNLERDQILEITVKTSSPPPGFVPIDRNAMEAIFMQSIKEADYLKTKAATTNNMQKEEYAQLWRSVTNNNFDEYWTIIQKLMEEKDGKEFDHIPLRVCMKNKPFKQILISSKDKSGSLITIGDAIAQVLEDSAVADPSDFRITSHGIDVPPHTPLIFAAKNMAYPDNFVHIVVVPKL
uniref:Autophagy protein 5 n=1 Tax=Caenorhabditis japonica TaxID=281687 RepID=A0A8R1DGD0_CAEJA